MSGCATLIREMDLWAQDGQTVQLWRRDDDLASPTPHLEPMLATANRPDLVPPLAVVSAPAVPELPDRLTGYRVETAVRDHRHVNHEHADAKKSEFGLTRSLFSRIADVAAERQ